VLHLSLFALTAVTVLVTGALWEGTFDRLPGVGAILLHILRHPSSLVPGIPFAASLLAILASHEMGHYLACRRHGIPATLPYFIPGIPPFGTFGAVIRIRGVIPNRRALFDVAAAGPIAGFVVAVPILIWGLVRAAPVSVPVSGPGIYFGSPLLSMLLERLFFGGSDLNVDSVFVAGWFGILVTSMNLFPVGQLDGGHAAYALSKKLHRNLARWTMIGMIGLVVVETALYRALSAYTLWCVVLILMRDRHPRLADEVTPLDPLRRLGVWLLLVIFILSFIPVPISL
jgi:membrane-associated protease RseP (regulator of RpoE activity)